MPNPPLFLFMFELTLMLVIMSTKSLVTYIHAITYRSKLRNGNWKSIYTAENLE